MESFNELFWNVSGADKDGLDILLQFLIFIGLWGLIFYILYRIMIRFSRLRASKDFQIRHSLLLALIIFQFLVCLYLFFLFKREGTDFLRWEDLDFYLGFGPQLLLFFGTIGFFMYFLNRYRKELKKKLID